MSIRSLRCSLSVLVGFLVIEIAGAHSPPPVLNPQAYIAPSGEYQLTVDPSTMYGQGAGDHRLTRDGTEVWSKRLPFTLWEAVVTDEGIVVGYAYTHGLHGFPAPEQRRPISEGDGEGELHIVLIDGSGRMRLDKAEKREPSAYPGDDTAYPAVLGVFVDAVQDRFVIQYADPDINRRASKWHAYRLTDGRKLGAFQPGQWIESTYGIENHEAILALQTQLETCNGVLTVRGDRQFELWMPEQAARLRFDVTPVQTSRGRCKVVRTVLEGKLDEEDEAKPDIEPIQLKLSGQVKLQAKLSPRRSVGALLEFDFDEQGSIGFIRYEQEGARAFVLVKPTGEVIHEQCLNTVADPYGAWSTAWLKDDQWIVIHSPGGAEAKSDAWLLDVSARSMTPIEEFDCPAVEAVDGCDDGSFVVLARHRYRYTSTPELIAFDADGRRRWSIKGETPDREGLFSPEDIAVTAGGTIAVIDSIRKVVQLFDKNGKRGRTIDLLKAFGHEPNYPTGIATDTNGGFIVHDFGGSPSNWRLSPDGQVVAKLEPRFADARKLDTDGLKAGLGRLWTTDGHSLFRLTDDGLVDLVVPPLPETDEIAGVAGFTVDHRGLFYVVSTRTGAVHVFDPSGRLLRVMEPLPGDFATNMWAAEMTVAGDGSVFVRESLSFEPGSYLKFSCEGKRIGRLEQSEEVFRQRWHFKPASLQRWIAGYQEVLLVDEGGKRLQTIKRRPDRNWLQRVGPLGVAPDGGVAVSSTNADTFGPGEPAISLYGPQGEPLKTIKLPIADHVLDVAYDGRWIVVSTESGLLVVDSQDGTVRKLTQPATSAHPHWNVFFVPDPPGLLLHEEGTLGVLRYQMPE